MVIVEFLVIIKVSRSVENR